MPHPVARECVTRVYKQNWFSRTALLIGLAALTCITGVASHVDAHERYGTPEDETKWMQGLIDEFRAQLGVPQKVSVTIVPKNPLMVSVEPVDDRASAFTLSIEESFLVDLKDDEVRAALAHELGHVWIFTHHPFLQTEGLANEIARRLVARDNLVRVYEKVWQRQGTTGDLARLIGD
jgi:hypothetical protein